MRRLLFILICIISVAAYAGEDVNPPDETSKDKPATTQAAPAPAAQPTPTPAPAPEPAPVPAPAPAPAPEVVVAPAPEPTPAPAPEVVVAPAPAPAPAPEVVVAPAPEPTPAPAPEVVVAPAPEPTPAPAPEVVVAPAPEPTPAPAPEVVVAPAPEPTPAPEPSLTVHVIQSGGGGDRSLAGHPSPETHSQAARPSPPATETTPTSPVAASSAAPAPTTHTPSGTGYTPADHSRPAGPAPGSAPNPTHYSPPSTAQPLPAPDTTGRNPGGLQYRRQQTTGKASDTTGTNTPDGASYKPGDTSRPADRPASGTPRQPFRHQSFTSPADPRPAPGATGQNPGHSANRPEAPGTTRPGSGKTGYRPGNPVRPPQPHPRDTNHLISGPVGSHGPRPGAKTYTSGYWPNGKTHSTGYRPAYTVPHGYTPSTYHLGRYYYPGPRAKRPYFYGHWVFDEYPSFTRRSVYCNFGIYPYIDLTRIIVEETPPEVVYTEEPLYADGVAYDSQSRYAGLDEALADIRSGWIAGRFDLIRSHVLVGRKIAVFLDGKYDYTMSSDDYLSMTHDAIGDMETVSFIWDKVREREDGQVTAFGSHTYRSNDEDRTVYISYTLSKIADEYYITEVGSSAEPLDIEEGSL